MKTFKALTILAIVVVISAFTANSVLKSMGKGYAIGDTAADFNLRNVDSKMVSLKDFEKAKGFIIVFTCNTCPFSNANENRIIRLDQKYKNLGYPVIAINPNNPNLELGDSFEEMQKRARQKGYTFPYLLDEGQKVFPKYGATKTPHVYVLQKDNDKNIVKYIGAIDNSSRDEKKVTARYLENAVNALLEGRDIEVVETKALGCAIKV